MACLMNLVSGSAVFLLLVFQCSAAIVVNDVKQFSESAKPSDVTVTTEQLAADSKDEGGSGISVKLEGQESPKKILGASDEVRSGERTVGSEISTAGSSIHPRNLHIDDLLSLEDAGINEDDDSDDDDDAPSFLEELHERVLRSLSTIEQRLRQNDIARLWDGAHRMEIGHPPGFLGSWIPMRSRLLPTPWLFTDAGDSHMRLQESQPREPLKLHFEGSSKLVACLTELPQLLDTSELHVEAQVYPKRLMITATSRKGDEEVSLHYSYPLPAVVNPSQAIEISPRSDGALAVEMHVYTDQPTGSSQGNIDTTSTKESLFPLLSTYVSNGTLWKNYPRDPGFYQSHQAGHAGFDRLDGKVDASLGALSMFFAHALHVIKVVIGLGVIVAVFLIIIFELNIGRRIAKRSGKIVP